MDLREFLSKVSFKSDSWDDYGYRQTAEISFDSECGEKKFSIKIYPNTDENFKRIKNNKLENANECFLWGSSQKYYQFILNALENETDRNRWFELTGDIAYQGQKFITRYNKLEEERKNDQDKDDTFGLFYNSFFRDQTKLEWQERLNALHRLTINKSFLSDYKFTIKKGSKKLFEVDVKPKDNIFTNSDGKSLPVSVSNNVFCIIGENGSGKTNFIREFSKAIFNDNSAEIKIENIEFDTQKDANVMNRVVYCSFSPFDKKFRIDGLPDSEKEEKFKYIGLLDYDKDNQSLDEKITKDILDSLKIIKVTSKEKSQLWLDVMERVSFEKWTHYIVYLFRDELVVRGEATSVYEYTDREKAERKVGELSSGQKIFLLTITKLILNLTERTIVFVDEPELFLHPPMVKSYVRLIADVVSYVNGLGFIITHSPITLQEFPNKCVKLAYRDCRGEYLIKDIDFKTFGENINIINDKIFNVGLQQSGYYNLIEKLKFGEQDENNLHRILDFAGSEARLLINLFLEGNSK